MKYAGVTFNRMSIAGFDVQFDRPDALVLSLWICFSYFLYRYYQYFSGEGVEKLTSVFHASLERKCKWRIVEIVRRRFPDANPENSYSFHTLRQSNWVFRGTILPVGQDGRVAESVPFKQLVHRRELAWQILRAFGDSILRNSVVTDYMLPFFIAGFVLWYCGTNDWYGSPMRFIFGALDGAT